MAMVALMLMGFTQAEYNVTHYCQLVKPGTKLPSLDSCENYYTCLANGQITADSCGSGQVFNKDVQQCGIYKCFDNPCQNEHKKFVPSFTKCGEWHYCENSSSSGVGSCPKGQILDYDLQSCKHGDCSKNGGDTVNDCQIMPNGIYFADTKKCENWYKCNGLDKKEGECKDGNVSAKLKTSLRRGHLYGG